ncbi:hypothetical protein [Rhodococcus sp. 27YEA15]|uniref:hypothetical protein n=1 Tax=Rhodococcus sp. 27YEA15 TaxID=3156259 RepID=UPI003C7C860F
MGWAIRGLIEDRVSPAESSSAVREHAVKEMPVTISTVSNAARILVGVERPDSDIYWFRFSLDGKVAR